MQPKVKHEFPYICLYCEPVTRFKNKNDYNSHTEQHVKYGHLTMIERGYYLQDDIWIPRVTV